MTSFEKWDVVTAMFPFTDQAVRKPRPVLVLSDAMFNDAHQHLIGAMITTGAGSTWPSDVSISDLDAAGLNHASLVRWKLFTLPLSVIGKKIGELGPRDRQLLTERAGSILPFAA